MQPLKNLELSSSSLFFTHKCFYKIFGTLPATKTLRIYQLVEFVVLKSAFIKFLLPCSVCKTHGVYQLSDFVVLKSAFIKFLILDLKVEKTEFINQLSLLYAKEL